MTPGNEGLLRSVSLRHVPLFRALALRVTPFFLISILFSVIAVWAQREGGAVSSLNAHPLADRLGNVLTSYTLYLEKFFYPKNLSVFYPHLDQVFLYGQTLRGLALIVITILLYAFRRRLGIVPLMGWFFFMVTLLPVIGLVQIGAQSHADRYMYGPIIGLILLVICVGKVFFHSLNTPSIRTVAVLLGFSWFSLLCLTSYARISDWRNSFTLSLSSLETSPDNPIITGIYVNSLIKQGYVEEARRILRRQISLYPNYATNYANLATCEYMLGDNEAAINHQKDFVALSPREGAGLTYLAKYYLEAGNRDEAGRIVAQLKAANYELRETEREILRTLVKRISGETPDTPIE
jgi:tetratricopeptide (TPR) repeat protein